MSTLKTHNLQSPDSGSANIALAPNAGMVVSGISTFGGDVNIADKIIHSGDTNTAIRFPAADTFTVETGGSERFRIDSTGNTLIYGVLRKDYVSSSLVITGGNAADSSANIVLHGSSGSPANVTQFKTGSTERMRISSAGDVGVGNNAPSCKLAVTDTATHTAYAKVTPSVGDCMLALYNNPSSEAINNHSTIQLAVNGGSHNRVNTISAVAESASNRKMATTFCTDSSSNRSERMRITGDGLVGIGTDIPGGLFHTHTASGTNRNLIEASASHAFLRLKAGSTSHNSGVEFYSSSSNIANLSALGGGGVTFEVGGSERLRITSAGKVNIGGDFTASTYGLQVYGSGGSDAATIGIKNNTSGPAGIHLLSGHGNWSIFNSETVGDALEFRDESANATRMLINSTGNATFSGSVTATSFESTTFSKTPTNTPAFHAWSNNVTSHPLSDSTVTKVEFLNSETFDTDSAFDNATSGTTASRFTVPTGKGGYYQISAGLNFFANNNDMRHCRVIVKQNTDIKLTSYNIVTGSSDGDIRHFQANISGILQLAAGDYIELFGYIDTNGNTQGYISNDAQGYRGNHFSAYKLII